VQVILKKKRDYQYITQKSTEKLDNIWQNEMKLS
jgi:hypothetical protein